MVVYCLIAQYLTVLTTKNSLDLTRGNSFIMSVVEQLRDGKIDHISN